MPAGVIKQADYLAIQSAKSRVEAERLALQKSLTPVQTQNGCRLNKWPIFNPHRVMLMDVVIQSTNCSP